MGALAVSWKQCHLEQSRLEKRALHALHAFARTRVACLLSFTGQRTSCSRRSPVTIQRMVQRICGFTSDTAFVLRVCHCVHRRVRDQLAALANQNSFVGIDIRHIAVGHIMAHPECSCRSSTDLRSCVPYPGRLEAVPLSASRLKERRPLRTTCLKTILLNSKIYR